MEVRAMWALTYGCSLLVAGMTFGCRTTTRARIPGADWPEQIHIEALTRSQYEVLGRASGEACAEHYALWPLPIFWIQYDGQSGRSHEHERRFGIRTEATAARSALYKAMLSQPDADVIMFPRSRSATERKGIWYRKSCVRVEGKAIRIMLDDELTPGEHHERPATVDAIVR